MVKYQSINIKEISATAIKSTYLREYQDQQIQSVKDNNESIMDIDILESMKANIKINGVMTPISVRLLTDEEKATVPDESIKYGILDGHTRYNLLVEVNRENNEAITSANKILDGEIEKLKKGIDESNKTRQERIEESQKNIDSKKIRYSELKPEMESLQHKLDKISDKKSKEAKKIKDEIKNIEKEIKKYKNSNFEIDRVTDETINKEIEGLESEIDVREESKAENNKSIDKLVMIPAIIYGDDVDSKNLALIANFARLDMSEEDKAKQVYDLFQQPKLDEHGDPVKMTGANKGKQKTLTGTDVAHMLGISIPYANKLKRMYENILAEKEADKEGRIIEDKDEYLKKQYYSESTSSHLNTKAVATDIQSRINTVLDSIREENFNVNADNKALKDTIVETQKILTYIKKTVTDIPSVRKAAQETRAKARKPKNAEQATTDKQ